MMLVALFGISVTMLVLGLLPRGEWPWPLTG